MLGKSLAEGSDFLAGCSLAAIQAQGESQDQTADAFLPDELGDAPKWFGFVQMDALYRVGEDAAGIRRSYSNARLSVVYAECRVHG